MTPRPWNKIRRCSHRIKATADFFPPFWLDDVKLFGRLLGLRQRTDKRFTWPWNKGEICHEWYRWVHEQQQTHVSMFSYNSAVLKCNLCHISIWNTEDYLCVRLSGRDIVIHSKNNAGFFFSLTSSAVFTWQYPGRICMFLRVVVWSLYALSMNGVYPGY